VFRITRQIFTALLQALSAELHWFNFLQRGSAIPLHVKQLGPVKAGLVIAQSGGMLQSCIRSGKSTVGTGSLGQLQP